MSDRKHILIVSNACYPELSPRAFRTTELVRELVRRGHRVTLLLPNRETYRRNPLTGDGLQIVYSSSRLEPEKGTPTARRNRKIRSLLPKFAQRAVLYFYCHELRAKYDPGLCERLSELSGPFDAVLSISYPAAVHLAVSRAMRRNAALRSAVTIAEFSDPPFRGDVAPNVFPAYYLILKCWGRRFYLKRWARQFDYFTIPVEKALPCYTPYIDRDRVRIIPQGFDLSTVRRLPYTPHAKPVFAYAGRFYERIRDPKFFFDFLATLDTDFRFDLYVNYLDPCFREMIREAQGRVTGEIAARSAAPREADRAIVASRLRRQFRQCDLERDAEQTDRLRDERPADSVVQRADVRSGRLPCRAVGRLLGPGERNRSVAIRHSPDSGPVRGTDRRREKDEVKARIRCRGPAAKSSENGKCGSPGKGRKGGSVIRRNRTQKPCPAQKLRKIAESPERNTWLRKQHRTVLSVADRNTPLRHGRTNIFTAYGRIRR